MRKYKRYNYDKEIFNRDYLVYYLPLYQYIIDNGIIEFYDNFKYEIVSLKKLTYLIQKFNDIVPLYNTCMYLLSDNDDDSTMSNFYLMFKYIHKFEQRKTTMKKKIEYFLENYDCSFITMTFDDDNLKYANDVNIKRFLNKLGVEFICNVDYGGINGRKHYHAIITSQNIDLSLYKYGNLDIKKIVVKNSDKLAYYLLKLTAHGFKETDKVIYSRKKRK